MCGPIPTSGAGAVQNGQGRVRKKEGRALAPSHLPPNHVQDAGTRVSAPALLQRGTRKGRVLSSRPDSAAFLARGEDLAAGGGGIAALRAATGGHPEVREAPGEARCQAFSQQDWHRNLLGTTGSACVAVHFYVFVPEKDSPR